jgi:hypothetical protein
MNILFWVVWIIFTGFDIGFFSQYHEGREPDGWKKYAIAVVPGSGFYYKWLAEKESKQKS